MKRIHQDPEGLSVGHILLVAVAGIAIAAVAVGAGALLTPAELIGRPPRPDPHTPVAGVDRGPIAEEARGLERQRAARRRLDEYGWVDRDAGVARIPIERAMELVARGVRPPGAGEEAR